VLLIVPLTFINTAGLKLGKRSEILSRPRSWQLWFGRILLASLWAGTRESSTRTFALVDRSRNQSTTWAGGLTGGSPAFGFFVEFVWLKTGLAVLSRCVNNHHLHRRLSEDPKRNIPLSLAFRDHDRDYAVSAGYCCNLTTLPFDKIQARSRGHRHHDVIFSCRCLKS